MPSENKITARAEKTNGGGVLLESMLSKDMPQSPPALVTNQVTCALPCQMPTVLSFYLFISKILVLPDRSFLPNMRFFGGLFVSLIRANLLVD